MGWLQSTLAPLAAAAGFEPRRDFTVERMWLSGDGGRSSAGQMVTAETGLAHWAVQAVMEALAGPISSCPLMVFEDLGEGRRRPAAEHPLFEVLHFGVGRCTSQERRDEQMRHLAWYRNSYDIIHPAADGGPVGELEPVHPSRVVDVRRGTDGWVYYEFRRLAPRVGTDVLREDMVHHVRKAPLTKDGLRGQPVWESPAGRETLGRALAVEQFGALYFANGGSGGGVLEHPGNFKSKEDEQSFLESWRSGGSGVNRHKDRLLKYGVKYSPFTVKNDEAQFLETKKQSGYEVAGLWNMPPHRVGMLERATNNNVETQGLEYVYYALGPYIVADQQAKRRDLLIGEDRKRYIVEYNVADLLPVDFKTRSEGYFRGRQGGWWSVNDVRRMLKENPIGPAGDVYETPLNMRPAGEGSSGDR